MKLSVGGMSDTTEVCLIIPEVCFIHPIGAFSSRNPTLIEWDFYAPFSALEVAASVLRSADTIVLSI